MKRHMQRYSRRQEKRHTMKVSQPSKMPPPSKHLSIPKEEHLVHVRTVLMHARRQISTQFARSLGIVVLVPTAGTGEKLKFGGSVFEGTLGRQNFIVKTINNCVHCFRRTYV
jgi:hypothetical protein